MKIGFLQTRPVFGETGKNVEGAIKGLSRLEADLMVLPELFNSGYQFRDKAEARGLAEEIGEDIDRGPTVKRLIEAAGDLNMFIAAGLPERDGKKIYNSAVLVGPNGVSGHYRKAHLFAGEKKIFNKGDMPFTVQKIGKVRVGLMICFDWLFPEVTRTLALKGADIILHPSNLVLPNCPDSMPVRSLENRVFAVTANRVGTEERIAGESLTFIGKSQITGPTGRILHRAPRGRAASCVLEIDPRAARDKHITPANHVLKDRRTDLYEN